MISDTENLAQRLDALGFTLISGFVGEGAFGRVYRVRDCMNRTFALKEISKGRLPENWQCEFEGVRQYSESKLENAHLVPIPYVYSNEDFFYYTMPLADNVNVASPDDYVPDTLAWRLKNSPLILSEIVTLVEDLLSALESLHRTGLTHGDVKPENILYIHGKTVLSDMGLVRWAAMPSADFVSSGFCAPERLGTSPIKYPERADYYALGRVIYCAFTGYSADRFPEMPSYLFSPPEGRRLNRLILQLCEPDPEHRLCNPTAIRASLKNLGATRSKRHRIAFYFWMGCSILLVMVLVVIFAFSGNPIEVSTFMGSEPTESETLADYLFRSSWQRTPLEEIYFSKDFRVWRYCYVADYTDCKITEGEWGVDSQERLVLNWHKTYPREYYAWPTSDTQLIPVRVDSAHSDSPYVILTRQF